MHLKGIRRVLEHISMVESYVFCRAESDGHITASHYPSKIFCREAWPSVVNNHENESNPQLEAKHSME
jgi:hypothetical protein